MAGELVNWSGNDIINYICACAVDIMAKKKAVPRWTRHE